MLSAKQGLLVPFLQCLWYDTVLDWGLNPGPLKASTLPLGYRGGGEALLIIAFSQSEGKGVIYLFV